MLTVLKLAIATPIIIIAAMGFTVLCAGAWIFGFGDRH